MHTRNFATDEDGLGDRMNDLFRIAFNEDKEILEAIQIEELKCRDHRPVKIAIDKGANMYRRIVLRHDRSRTGAAVINQAAGEGAGVPAENRESENESQKFNNSPLIGRFVRCRSCGFRVG